VRYRVVDLESFLAANHVNGHCLETGEGRPNVRGRGTQTPHVTAKPRVVGDGRRNLLARPANESTKAAKPG